MCVELVPHTYITHAFKFCGFVCVCRIAKIVKDEEILQHIAQSDSDLPSETDDSFELSLESYSSVLEQTPKV